MKPTYFMLLLALPHFLACASNTATEQAKKAPATRYDQGLNETPQQQSGYIPCGQSTTSQTNSNIINGNQLFVTTAQGQRQSLCQTLLQSGKQVAIFQVSGLLCQSCQDEAKYVNQQQLGSVAHFLVFTDSQAETDPRDVENFRQLAPQSGQLFDQQKTLANELNPGHAFGTVLVLAKSGKYKLYLTAGLEHTWFPEAQRMSREGNFNTPTPQYQDANGQTQTPFNQNGQPYNQPYYGLR